jgi:hypothetical protein
MYGGFKTCGEIIHLVLGQAKGQTDDSKSNENKYPIQYY